MNSPSESPVSASSNSPLLSFSPQKLLFSMTSLILPKHPLPEEMRKADLKLIFIKNGHRCWLILDPWGNLQFEITRKETAPPSSEFKDMVGGSVETVTEFPSFVPSVQELKFNVDNKEYLWKKEEGGFVLVSQQDRDIPLAECTCGVEQCAEHVVVTKAAIDSGLLTACVISAKFFFHGAEE